MFGQQKVTAIVLAAGSSQRFGPRDKVIAPLCGKPVLVHSTFAFLEHPLVDQVVVVAGRESISRCRILLGDHPGLTFTIGGPSRTRSSWLGLQEAQGEIVVIHDGVRPLVTPEIITRCVEGAARWGAVAAAELSTDTVKLCDSEGLVLSTTERSRTWRVQTPQAFGRELLLNAYAKTDWDDCSITDDCMVAERQGIPVRMVEGAPFNIKITTPEDMTVAQSLAEQLGLGGRNEVRSAVGQDSHRFELPPTGKPLVLGGVPFPGAAGLSANSDGDVVLHALCNAISGVTCVNILGERADRLCQGGVRDSAVYVREALEHLRGQITHVSFSIECAQPKISPRIPQMRESVGRLLALPPDCVGITATTGEGLSDFGRGLGISVFCIITVEG